MRTILAGLVLLIVAGITWTWFWTIPQCLTSGWGTPGYSGTARSVTDDDGVFGCWYARVTKERVRAQAFEEWARDSERLERNRRTSQGRQYRGDD
jgi:hypothetical protein